MSLGKPAESEEQGVWSLVGTKMHVLAGGHINHGVNGYF